MLCLEFEPGAVVDEGLKAQMNPLSHVALKKK